MKSYKNFLTHALILSDICFNGFTGSDTFVESSGPISIKSPACRSVSDLVQLFKPAVIVDRDDLRRSSPACRSVSDLVKVFEQSNNKSLSFCNLSSNQKIKTDIWTYQGKLALTSDIHNFY